MERRLNKIFLKSLLEKENSIVTTEEALKWIKRQNSIIKVEVEQIAFSELESWGFNDSSLSHHSGKFFSIDGLSVTTNYGGKHQWNQPIINQPEIGYLGFITKEFNGVLHFLMQAKVEPGNINYVQLSPTLQATKSNYSRVHKGKAPAYLEYFQKATRENILLDQLQSEQGGRFLKKRNRNIIINVKEELEVLENFMWLSLAQIKELMLIDNIVNMDTRTVISGIPLGNFEYESLSLVSSISEISSHEFNKGLLKSCANDAKGINTLNDVILFITNHKCNFELDVTKIPLSALNDWVIDNTSIHHIDHKYFEIIAAKIKISNREVINWTQPMVKPAQDGICAFICKNINGVLHFLVQAKLECGNFDIIELAPTVQSLTEKFTAKSENPIPYLNYVLEATEDKILFDTLQSEEGGRFYREQNRNMIVFADSGFAEEIPDNFIWMTYSQLQTFIKHNNYINIQARSLMAALSFNLC
ncbi:NDP-hexose 2,3-dehydratase family protein [Christiangramia forsetii]|uniref:NDP-hexose 2,3-dehydratase n=2 Tax=Christiangramia forsetii TaxID=411153 RepID=A0M305_CHRFK|nr:NDP-hexose 2,3-dehydratase family protein [Christiangramia forsetii]GGG27068.1 dNDP-4-keto-6-deoxy-glucose-2,3- dehydratase [Christiangramia forsetii]CAL67000.1 NDP-hexose 2,3-dehydratase [Christiangramia forsetii KT0803]